MLFIPEQYKLGGGLALKPMTMTKMVKHFKGILFVVKFDGGYPIKKRISSYGMHFVNYDG